MIRNLKALGLALVAVFAMSAVAASAASASTQGEFTTPEPVNLIGTEEGEQEENRLTAFGGFVQCPGSIYTGHKYNVTPHEPVPNEVTTITLTPHYNQESCVGNANIPATVETNGCDYVLHLHETTGVNPGEYNATVDISCEITVKLWFTANQHTTEPENPKCVLHVPAQTELEGAVATDNGDGTLQLSGTVEGITVNQTRNSILCPSGTHTENGSFHVNVNVIGENELEEEVGVSLSHETE